MITKTVRFRSTRFLASVIVGICAAISVMGWSLSGHFAGGQGRERVIEKAFTRNEVVEFSETKVSQKDVEPGKGFEADDEWLNTVFVKVRNISKKPIVFLEVGFDFPETKATGSEMSYRGGSDPMHPQVSLESLRVFLCSQLTPDCRRQFQPSRQHALSR